MKLILKNGTTLLYKNGMGLTGLNIDSIVAESKADRADLRMLLVGALKVDGSGCHSLGRDFGSNACAGSDLKTDYSLEEKLRIIDTLTAAIQRNEPMMYPHTKEAETKLLALVQSI